MKGTLQLELVLLGRRWGVLLENITKDHRLGEEEKGRGNSWGLEWEASCMHELVRSNHPVHLVSHFMYMHTCTCASVH